MLESDKDVLRNNKLLDVLFNIITLIENKARSENRLDNNEIFTLPFASIKLGGFVNDKQVQ